MDSKAKTLVAGVGSPHGEDRIGWWAADRLRRRLPPSAWVVTTQVPLDLLSYFSPEIRCILVDTIDSGRPRGERHRLIWQPPGGWSGCTESWQSSTHAWGLTDTLALASSLGRCPHEVILFGIECGPSSLPIGLSSLMNAAAPSEMAGIARELRFPLEQLEQDVLELWLAWKQEPGPAVRRR